MKIVFPLAALAALAVTVAGCSSSPATPHVASLAGPGSTTVPSSAASATPSSRPRLRLDMTTAEENAMYAPYTKCLIDHGIPSRQAQQHGAPKPSDAAVQKANQACGALLPLPPWEEDASNPQAVSFQLKVVDCLRKKGVKFVTLSNDPTTGLVGPSFGGPQNDQQSITQGLALTPQCEQQVAAQH